MKKTILLCFLFILPINFANTLNINNVHKIPQSQLQNPGIQNVPPVKIEGFVLGMLKKDFNKLLYFKYKKDKVNIIELQKKNPNIQVYKVKTGTTLNFAFYIYGNMLAKIYIIILRPYGSMNTLLQKHMNRYGRVSHVWQGKTGRFYAQGFYWKKYFWQSNYNYKPGFDTKWLDIPVVITLDFSMRYRFVRRAVYGYCYSGKFLNQYFGTYIEH